MSSQHHDHMRGYGARNANGSAGNTAYMAVVKTAPINKIRVYSFCLHDTLRHIIRSEKLYRKGSHTRGSRYGRHCP